MFLVKWEGYAQNTWEEFENFVKHEPKLLKEYLVRKETELGLGHRGRKVKNDGTPPERKFICGHTNVTYASKGLCKNCYNKLYKQLKKNRNDKVFACPHNVTSKGRNIKTYANNMCRQCCWERGIFKAYATKCEHKDRAHYVRGYCKQCYKSKFEQPRRKNL